MGTQFEDQKSGYPGDLIRMSRTAPNGVVRLGMKKLRSARSAEGERLTFRETLAPKPGVIYDSFDIQSFTIDRNSGRAKVCAKMSLRENHEKLSVSAKLVDQASEQVLAALPLKTARNTFELDYDEEIALAADKEGDHVTLVVYGTWGTEKSNDSEIAIVEEYAAGAPSIEYTHVHPAQHKGHYITFPQGKALSEVKQAMSYTAADCTVDNSHIIVALYRKPQDTSDLDYLCLFGQKPGTSLPILGLPGKGTLKALSGSKFLYSGNDKPAASCCITPIGGNSGGRMLVAASSSYAAGEGAITLNCNGASLDYDMTGPWGVAYNEIGSWQTKYFHYEFVISYTVQTGSGTPKRHTSYICSNRDVCLKKVDPIALKYGCFREGTNIAMADGSQKKIENIHIGDHVWSEGGRMTAVRNIWSGKDIILNISLEDGTLLGVTGDHPLKTLDGWVKAKDIKAGMSLIKAMDNRSLLVCSAEEGLEEMVYNLETGEESGAALCANGIAAGDFAMQNNM